jgi:predicted Ser/Thr protein kinase
MTKLSRMSISVPQELKDQMESVERRVSWSQVACRAFREEIANRPIKPSRKAVASEFCSVEIATIQGA